MQSLKVWFPTVKTNTGTDIFTKRLVKELQKRGVKAEITWLPLRSEYAPWSVKKPRPPSWANLIHVNTWLNPRFIPKNIPVIATIHHAVHHQDLLPYKGLIRAAYHRYWIAPLERKVMRRASNVVGVSQFVADTARKALAELPINVIYNGVDTKKYKPNEQSIDIEGPFKLLYLGSWSRRKGVDLLEPIMLELGKDFELSYTGIDAKNKKQPSARNMHNIGRLESEQAVIKAMQSADAFLFPSRSEGHPLVCIEAMACGLPVVTTDSPPFQEIIKNRVTGILCEANNIHNFASAIANLQSTPTLTCRIARNARSEVVEQYSMQQMVDSYIRCYEATIQNTHA